MTVWYTAFDGKLLPGMDTHKIGYTVLAQQTLVVIEDLPGYIPIANCGKREALQIFLAEIILHSLQVSENSNIVIILFGIVMLFQVLVDQPVILCGKADLFRSQRIVTHHVTSLRSGKDHPGIPRRSLLHIGKKIAVGHS